VAHAHPAPGSAGRAGQLPGPGASLVSSPGLVEEARTGRDYETFDLGHEEMTGGDLTRRSQLNISVEIRFPMASSWR
jgi:hypothetical protein